MSPLEAADALAEAVHRHLTADIRDRARLEAVLATYTQARVAAAVAPVLGPVTEDGKRAARAWSLWHLGSPTYASDMLAVATDVDPMATLVHMLGDIGEGRPEPAYTVADLTAEANPDS